MQFYPSTALALLVAATSAVGDVYNPIGQPCSPQGAEGCANDVPSLNGGNAFVYECGPADKFVYVAGCACSTCCTATTNGAYCT
ncbi:uncharacterized protein B0H18DRAFT_987832 [Fomitopsis serialis]|uniref:uncharacterized protein n=1 Tax=Fomitopsis serialis TaxID=139415 RepID=UPI0020073CCA|nr:uncharacterized protein B0H18DRAFT_987832 [Neoantrodia serialis]KAH9932371.1 hypothetical protein B0H18DRAFT_987832 [Neoantrodia serialis]